jgi:hypothetical protein
LSPVTVPRASPVGGGWCQEKWPKVGGGPQLSVAPSVQTVFRSSQVGCSFPVSLDQVVFGPTPPGPVAHVSRSRSGRVLKWLWVRVGTLDPTVAFPAPSPTLFRGGVDPDLTPLLASFANLHRCRWIATVGNLEWAANGLLRTSTPTRLAGPSGRGGRGRTRTISIASGHEMRIGIGSATGRQCGTGARVGARRKIGGTRPVRPMCKNKYPGRRWAFTSSRPDPGWRRLRSLLRRHLLRRWHPVLRQPRIPPTQIRRRKGPRRLESSEGIRSIVNQHFSYRCEQESQDLI